MPSVVESLYNLTLFDFKAICFIEILLYFNSLLTLLQPHTSVSQEPSRTTASSLSLSDFRRATLCLNDFKIHAILKKEIFLMGFKCNNVILFLNVALYLFVCLFVCLLF